MVSKYPKMNKLFKGQISFRAVFSKCARARYYHGILAATEYIVMDWFYRCIGVSMLLTEQRECVYIYCHTGMEGGCTRENLCVLLFQDTEEFLYVTRNSGGSCTGSD